MRSSTRLFGMLIIICDIIQFYRVLFSSYGLYTQCCTCEPEVKRNSGIATDNSTSILINICWRRQECEVFVFPTEQWQKYYFSCLNLFYKFGKWFIKNLISTLRVFCCIIVRIIYEIANTIWCDIMSKIG